MLKTYRIEEGTTAILCSAAETRDSQGALHAGAGLEGAGAFRPDGRRDRDHAAAAEPQGGDAPGGDAAGLLSCRIMQAEVLLGIRMCRALPLAAPEAFILHTDGLVNISYMIYHHHKMGRIE